MSSICPTCKDKVYMCECGLDELFEGWGLNSNSVLDVQYSGSISDCNDDTDSCYGLSIFDSVCLDIAAETSDSYLPNYKGPIVGAYSIGDLVNYQPLWGIIDWNKPWIIKKVFTVDPLDCAFYDYEITDGHETHLVTHYEVNRIGKDEKIQK